MQPNCSPPKLGFSSLDLEIANKNSLVKVLTDLKIFKEKLFSESQYQLPSFNA
jgi:hypothetical protein